jgi:hypothetical protein
VVIMISPGLGFVTGGGGANVDGSLGYPIAHPLEFKSSHPPVVATERDLVSSAGGICAGGRARYRVECPSLPCRVPERRVALGAPPQPGAQLHARVARSHSPRPEQSLGQPRCTPSAHVSPAAHRPLPSAVKCHLHVPLTLPLWPVIIMISPGRGFVTGGGAGQTLMAALATPLLNSLSSRAPIRLWWQRSAVSCRAPEAPVLATERGLVSSARGTRGGVEAPLARPLDLALVASDPHGLVVLPGARVSTECS